MAGGVAADKEAELSIGRVLARGFETLAVAPAACVTCVLLFNTLPALASAYATDRFWTPVADAAGDVGVGLLVGAALIVANLLGSVGAGVIAPVTAEVALGRPVRPRAALRALAPALPGLLGLAALLALATVAGLLLVVPGLIASTVWAVAAPASTIERRGVRCALRRSRELTRGVRWRVFALVALLTTCVYGFLITTDLLFFGVTEGWATIFRDGPAELSIGYWAWTAAMQTVASAPLSAVYAALYVELREWKDGPATDRLADIFA